MNAFSAEWLALREAADGRARDPALPDRLPRPVTSVIDLGAGTGSNLRWLAPRLGRGQRWTLVDHDAELLARALPALRRWAGAREDFDCGYRLEALDLAGNLDALRIPRSCLVTASALLDLVSQAWLEDLVTRVAAARASVLWALSYDGRIALDPSCDDDTRIVELVNSHQRTDKGFGPALGPDAWQVAERLLAAAGYEVVTAVADWCLRRDEQELIVALVEGWAGAAVGIAPDETESIARWRDRRLGEARTGSLEVRVGHRDLVASPRP